MPLAKAGAVETLHNEWGEYVVGERECESARGEVEIGVECLLPLATVELLILILHVPWFHVRIHIRISAAAAAAAVQMIRVQMMRVSDCLHQCVGESDCVSLCLASLCLCSAPVLCALFLIFCFCMEKKQLLCFCCCFCFWLLVAAVVSCMSLADCRRNSNKSYIAAAGGFKLIE